MNNNLITELLCTRISHDLAGSIGAVANAVELLEEGDMEFLDDIKSILKTSSQNLSDRMKFFRLACGIENANLNDADMVKSVTKNYLATLGNKDYPITLNWEICNPKNNRAAMLMTMTVADLLIRGGTLNLYDNDKKIIAEFSKTLKISTEKLDKIKTILQNGSTVTDATTAPLQMLLTYNANASLYLQEINDNILLIKETDL